MSLNTPLFTATFETVPETAAESPQIRTWLRATVVSLDPQVPSAVLVFWRNPPTWPGTDTDVFQTVATAAQLLMLPTEPGEGFNYFRRDTALFLCETAEDVTLVQERITQRLMLLSSELRAADTIAPSTTVNIP